MGKSDKIKCCTCKLFLEQGCFALNSASRTGRQNECRECRRIRNRLLSKVKLVSVKNKKGEIWKSIFGYENVFEVSNKGRVKRLNRIVNERDGKIRWISEKVYKRWIGTNGYDYVRLRHEDKSKTFAVHRLVALAFIPNPQNLKFVCHKNDIRSDNKVDNLFWGSPKDNAMDMANKNRCSKWMNKLSTKQVRNVRKLLSKGIKQSVLSAKYNLTQSCISEIKHYKTYKNI